jgi:hypothetical protein
MPNPAGSGSASGSGSSTGHADRSTHAGVNRPRTKHSTVAKPAPSLPGRLTAGAFPSVPDFPALPGFNAPVRNGSAGDDSPSDTSDDSSGDDSSRWSGDDAGRDSGDPDPGQPAGPDDPPAWVGRPSCHERGECGVRPSHHHRPDFSRHRRCGNSALRAYWSHHRTVHIDRSTDRPEQRRRSAVTERPQNIRPARVLERSYTSFHNAGHHNAGYHNADQHSRQSIPGARSPESRAADDNQLVNRSYRGSHRAGGQHHADRQTPAEQRSSRVGKHHADQQDDHRGRS